MNTSMIYYSLQYLEYNFSIVASLSKWIYQELTIFNYDDSKFQYQLLKNTDNAKIVKELIPLVQNNSELKYCLLNLCLMTYNKNIKKKIIILLSSESININYPIDDDLYLVHIIKKNLNYKLVKLFLKNGAIISYISIKYVIIEGHYDVLQLMINYGADILSFEENFLRFSVDNNDHNTMKILLQNGCDINCDESFLLFRAARINDLKMFKFLLEYKIDVHARQDSILACDLSDAIKILLRKNGATTENGTKCKSNENERL